MREVWATGGWLLCAAAVLGSSALVHAQDDDTPEPEPEPTVESAPAPHLHGPPEAAPAGLDRPIDDDAGPTAPEDGSADPLPPALEWDAADAVPPRDVVTASPRTLVGNHLGVWLEVGFTSGGSPEESVTALSPEMGVRYRLADAIVADVSWGFTYGYADVRGEAIVGGSPTPFDARLHRVEPGNPILSGAWSQSFDDDARVEIGLGVAMPTAARAEPGGDAEGLAERRASLVTHRAALAMRGHWSPWRWAPERFALFLPARIAAPIDALVIEGEIGVGLMFPVLGDRTATTDVILQASAGAGGQVAGPFHLGARVRVVGAARGLLAPIDQLDAPRDDAMFSVQPWARLRFDPVHVSLSVSLNLSGVDGLGGSRGPAFGSFASIGAEL